MLLSESSITLIGGFFFLWTLWDRNDQVRGRGGVRGRIPGGACGVKNGRGNGRRGGMIISAQDLDTDFDMYHAAAKETS